MTDALCSKNIMPVTKSLCQRPRPGQQQLNGATTLQIPYARGHDKSTLNATAYKQGAGVPGSLESSVSAPALGKGQPGTASDLPWWLTLLGSIETSM